MKYDQGEDRWLCTLMLMQGWKIEYSAASDSYTAAPTDFNEFYNQRRRWMPSTIFNIFDLLSNYKQVVASNPNISYGYIAYQFALMLGTALGPGSIFLMLIGALQSAFKLGFRDAFLFNFFPIAVFMGACQFAKKDVQLQIAQLLTVFYVLVMLAVYVGIFLQIAEDGIFSPTGFGLLIFIGSFVLSAGLHPQGSYITITYYNAAKILYIIHNLCFH